MKWRTSGVTWQRVCRLGICCLGLSTKREVSTICLDSWILFYYYFYCLLFCSLRCMGRLFCGLQWASIAQSRTSSWPPRNIGRWWQGYARKTVNCSCFGYYTPSWLCCHSYCLGCGEVRESKSCCCLPDSHSEKITIQEMLDVAPLVEQHRILFFLLAAPPPS